MVIEKYQKKKVVRTFEFGFLPSPRVILLLVPRFTVVYCYLSVRLPFLRFLHILCFSYLIKSRNVGIDFSKFGVIPHHYISVTTVGQKFTGTTLITQFALVYSLIRQVTAQVITFYSFRRMCTCQL